MPIDECTETNLNVVMKVEAGRLSADAFLSCPLGSFYKVGQALLGLGPA